MNMLLLYQDLRRIVLILIYPLILYPMCIPDDNISLCYAAQASSLRTIFAVTGRNTGCGSPPGSRFFSAGNLFFPFCPSPFCTPLPPV
jgi:hypothetical protein